MSFGDLEAMISLIPKIRDHERLNRIMDIAAGNGVMRRHIMQRHIKQLRRNVNEQRTATTQELAAAGIKVIRG